MDKVLVLLELQKKARESASLGRFGFNIVNHTHALVPYAQGVFWTLTGGAADGQVLLEAVSGNARLDEQAEGAQALKAFIRQSLDQKAAQRDAGQDARQEGWSEVRLFGPDLCAPPLADLWAALNTPAAACVIFKTPSLGILGGMWLERGYLFEEAEAQVLNELAQSYAQSLALLRPRSHFLTRLTARVKSLRALVLAGVVLACFIPVRLSVTATAEVVAQKPSLISIPFDGVLEAVLVRPGEMVKAGQALIRLDQAALKAQHESAEQALSSAREAYARFSREILTQPDKKVDMARAQSDIKARTIDFEYAKTLLARSTVPSPADGVAIFADVNALEGKPVRTGEKVMMVADPSLSELLIRVPVDAMIPIRADSPVYFFMNVSPLSRRGADIVSIGYQSSVDPDGLLTYKIRARIDAPDVTETSEAPAANLRIGWKGTAQIKGDWTLLGYALLRRPIIILRTALGI